MRTRYKKIRCEPYGCVVHAFIGSDETVLLARYRKLRESLGPAYNEEKFIEVVRTGDGCTHFNGGPQLVVHVKRPDDVETICHEASHATSFIFEYVGMPHTRDSDEAYAYMTGYIAREIWTDRKAKPKGAA